MRPFRISAYQLSTNSPFTRPHSTICSSSRESVKQVSTFGVRHSYKSHSWAQHLSIGQVLYVTGDQSFNPMFGAYQTRKLNIILLIHSVCLFINGQIYGHPDQQLCLLIPYSRFDIQISIHDHPISKISIQYFYIVYIAVHHVVIPHHHN